MVIKQLNFLFFLLFFLWSGNVSLFATHIRAGEISVERVSSTENTYRISLIIYADTRSTVLPGGGELDLGDGNVISLSAGTPDIPVIFLDNGVARYVYQVEHTYSDELDSITIGYVEFNRNPDIINMENSVNTPFYTETTFSVNTPCGINSTPQLLIPPLDFAVAGAEFIHNPGAFDPDGDSVSYELVIPRQSATREVNGYFFPENLHINPVTGEILWEVPPLSGEYNLAFAINEWRFVADSVVHLSRVIRDMQIIVVDESSEPPLVSIPPDTCLAAGEQIISEVHVKDPEKDPVKLESFSLAYLLEDSPANFQQDSISYKDPPFSRSFSWQTNDLHVRKHPYKIYFKASDRNSTGIPGIDIKAWNIKVSAKAPEEIRIDLQEDGRMKLSWDKYAYHAEKIRIFRRVTAYDFTSSRCFTGIPSFAGFEPVGEVDGSETEFYDEHSSGRFARGASYCYRLVAQINGCTSTQSAASDDICYRIPVDAPVITKVSVQETHEEHGSMNLEWTSSFDLDPARHDFSSFTYAVERRPGLTGAGEGIRITPNGYTDTTFTDTNINTKNNVFHYIIYLYEKELLIDSSATASMVNLSGDPLPEKISLHWNAEVPWSINTQKYPYHYIYRNRILQNDPESLILIDSVQVNFDGLLYQDSGRYDPEEMKGEYCYYVSTRGSYGNPAIYEPLINNSQVYCVNTFDTIPPCPPEVTIVNGSEDDCRNTLKYQPCSFSDFVNELKIMDTCGDEDIYGYNIYFSANLQGNFELLATVKIPEFQHEGLSSFKGCYRVSTVDLSGNESELSETVCNDNCPSFYIPNIFTPNGDGYNEYFTEYNSEYEDFTDACPRFVKDVIFTVYNRLGKEIYTYQPASGEDYWIQWDGSDLNRKKVPAGVYFYQADVWFDVLDTDEQKQSYTGWVQVLY